VAILQLDRDQVQLLQVFFRELIIILLPVLTAVFHCRQQIF